MKGIWLLLLVAASVRAAPPLPAQEAAEWLRKLADAPRRLNYEGVFVVRQGDAMQAYSVANLATPRGNESLLVSLDGNHREVRCSQNGGVTVVAEGGQVRMEKRLNKRHFPYLLPSNPLPLANWYEVRLGEMGRVAGLDCQNVELSPRDAYRWGYVLCAEKETGMPLKAVMVNASNQPLMQYTFAEVKLGVAPRLAGKSAMPAEMTESARHVDAEHIVARNLPPGFTRIAAHKRQLPDLRNEVEHWVFSDGMNHISLFLSHANKPMEPVKGESARGMVKMMRRQIGEYQATVLGDAPWLAVETIAQGLEPRR